MECYYHPSRESTDNCAICGKSICKECGLEIAGKVYCKECLEKIVGIGLSNNNPEPEVQPEAEPVRLERKEPPEVQIEMANLTKNSPQEVEFEAQESQKIADDSPYNIKDSIQYEGGIESSYDDSYQPRTSLHQAIENNQAAPEKPVEDVRQEYVSREPVTQARNEYDGEVEPQSPPVQDYIYPDHSYEPDETSARKAVEDKYERYLDDLYFDEDEIPLNEQLARDEAKFGSLTRNEYQPKNNHTQKVDEDEDLDRRIREELARREQEKRHPKKIHNIEYEDEKEPVGAVDIILTIILIIVILVVVFYILYIFILSSTYPTFIDAIMGLRDPSSLINALLSH